MPLWQKALLVMGGLCTLVTCAIGVAYFLDKYFQSRKAYARDTALKDCTARILALEGQAPTRQQLIDAEHRLSRIESDVMVLKETQELREKFNAMILQRNPRRPE